MAALRTRCAAAALTAAAVVAAAACESKTGDQEAFCTDLETNAQAIMNPQLATDADVEAHLAVYRDLDDEAPLAVEEDWGVLVEALEAADAVQPGDAESAEVARRAIYSAQQAAGRVRTWATTACGFDLASVGPIGTVPMPQPSTTVATVPG